MIIGVVLMLFSVGLVWKGLRHLTLTTFIVYPLIVSQHMSRCDRLRTRLKRTIEREEELDRIDDAYRERFGS